jgi:hypothetical protein
MQIRSIITVIVAFALISVGMTAEAVDNSLVLYFTFDEDQGDAVTDLSSYHNDGIMKGDLDQVEGIFGSALLFDGATTSVEVPHSASLSITDAITLEMWVELPNDGVNANNVGIEKGGWEPGEYSLYAFYVPGNGSAMQFMDLPVACGDANSGNLGPNLKDDQWHHIAGTWDGTTISIYTDGELSIEFGCKGGPLQANNKSVFIGARNGAERFLKGVVDEVRIYNRTLSQDEINKDMETLGGLAVSPSGKIGALWGEVKRAYH